jgi:hypothetical protein
MPRIVGLGSRTLRLSILVVVVLLAFTPISRALLAASDGSFSPSPYSSLAVRTSTNVPAGYQVGDLVPVRITNRTGSTKTYHWNASQHGVVVSLGETTLVNGQWANINVPTAFAAAGRLRIAISGTGIFVTVPMVKL